MPYCSSDLYVGTRDDSDVSGYYFHGKYIVKVEKMVAVVLVVMVVFNPAVLDERESKFCD